MKPTGDGSKAETVRQGERGGQEQGRVLMVFRFVEGALRSENLGDVVWSASVVVRAVGGHRQVLAVEGVGVVEDGAEEPEEEHDGGGDVGLCPPGSGEGRTNESDLRPVEGEDGHAEPRGLSEELVDDDVLRCDPAYPAEEREGLEEVAGEEVPEEGADEDVEEEPLTGDTAAGTDTGVLLRMEGVEQCAGDQIGGPDHGRGLHQKATSNTTNGETNLRK